MHGIAALPGLRVYVYTVQRILPPPLATSLARKCLVSVVDILGRDTVLTSLDAESKSVAALASLSSEGLLTFACPKP